MFKKRVCVISLERLVVSDQLRGVNHFESSERVTCFQRYSVSPCQPVSDGIIHWSHRLKAS